MRATVCLMATTWEYATIPLLIHNTKAILDQWGADGWELVQVVPGPDGTATALLYEDAGDGYAFEKGDYRITRYTVTQKDGKLTVSDEHVAGDRPTAVKHVTVRLAEAR